MANAVRPIRSNTAASVPSASALKEGEIAVNFADKKIYGKDSGGVVQLLVAPASSSPITNTPTALSAGANDYGLPAADIVRLSASAAVTLTGLSASNAATYPVVLIENVGSNTITLSNNSASSAAANRIVFSTGTDQSLAANDSITLVYDSTSTVWRSVGTATLAAVATSGSASDLTGTLGDARLSTNVALKELLNQWLGMSLSGVDAGPPLASNASNGFGTGNVHWTFFTPLVTTTVTSITYFSGTTPASGLTLCRFGIYTYNETTATLVARTDSNTGNFAAANTAYNRVLSATGGYPTSYTLNAGTRYGVAVIQVGTTIATLACSLLGPITVTQQNPKLAGYIGSQSDLPTSATSITGYTLRPYARLLP